MHITSSDFALLVSLLTAITALLAIAKSRRETQTRSVINVLRDNPKPFLSILSSMGFHTTKLIKDDVSTMINDRLQIAFANMITRQEFNATMNGLDRRLERVETDIAKNFEIVIRQLEARS